MHFLSWFGLSFRTAASAFGGAKPSGRTGRSRARDLLEPQETSALPPLDAESVRLVQRIRSGESVAFDTLYLTYFERIWRFATRQLRSSDMAADVAQDVFASIWLRRETWQPRISLDAYLFRAARNRMISLGRHAASTEAMIEKTSSAPPALGALGAGPDESAASADSLQKLRDAIDQLTERQREAVLLLCDRELNQVEIAAVLGVSEAAVRKLLANARARLRPTLQSMRSL